MSLKNFALTSLTVLWLWVTAHGQVANGKLMASTDKVASELLTTMWNTWPHISEEHTWDLMALTHTTSLLDSCIRWRDRHQESMDALDAIAYHDLDSGDKQILQSAISQYMEKIIKDIERWSNIGFKDQTLIALYIQRLQDIYRISEQRWIVIPEATKQEIEKRINRASHNELLTVPITASEKDILNSLQSPSQK